MGSDPVIILLIGVLQKAYRQKNWSKQIKGKCLV